MQKHFVLGWAVLFAAVFICRADGEKLATLKCGSETYSNVTVLSVTATDIYFSHSQGMGNAKLKNLDPAVQKMFHFNPDRAAEKEKQQTEDKALYAQVVEKQKLTAPRPPAPVEDVPGPPGLPDEVEPHEIAAKSFINQRAPAIVAEKWLSEPPPLKGKFLLVDFWGTWSEPCRTTMPKLNSFASTFKDRLVVVGLTDEPEEQIQKMTAPQIQFPIALDSQKRASRAFGVERIPHLVLIDPRGVVRFEGHPGYLDDRKLENLLTRFAE